MNTARFVFKSLIKRWMKNIFSREYHRDGELKPEWTSQGPGSIRMERYHHIDASEQDKDGILILENYLITEQEPLKAKPKTKTAQSPANDQRSTKYRPAVPSH
ncbi:hypothetical protein PSE10C_44330 [Pseudomonas amygdali pv. eriobotryae]|uniref:Uncharacterized protein n=1 Tax=Pseudomonas amygdali pv. eriobotryae TaxID=129137 RepID=A0A9P3AEW7_PSEA0|nr:hypothetical protein PSE10A_30020 [Pseudomonas amygdali pv. eriobotryae]GFZ73691.1 hypothetical protein PSE10C_44330 [Pseudomonas amygdali pv. eriobotryae]